jgi:hypothetical protein
VAPNRYPVGKDLTRKGLNEPGPTPDDTLDLEKIFVLRADPDLARRERLHAGSGDSRSQSLLDQDYSALLAELAETDPDR